MAHPPEEATAQAVAPLQPDLQLGCPPPQDFLDFYRREFRPLAQAVTAYGATPQEAEDAVAEAMDYILKTGKWPIPRNPFAYARRSALNYFLKSKDRSPQRTARRLVERGHVPHHEGCEDAHLTDLEYREWADEILGRLTPAQREALELVADGHNYKEIARRIGTTPATARKRVEKARSRLKAILAPDGEYIRPTTDPPRVSREEAR